MAYTYEIECAGLYMAEGKVVPRELTEEEKAGRRRLFRPKSLPLFMDLEKCCTFSNAATKATKAMKT